MTTCKASREVPAGVPARRNFYYDATKGGRTTPPSSRYFKLLLRTQGRPRRRHSTRGLNVAGERGPDRAGRGWAEHTNGRRLWSVLAAKRPSDIAAVRKEGRAFVNRHAAVRGLDVVFLPPRTKQIRAHPHPEQNAFVEVWGRW